MGDNLYTTYWQSVLPKIIEQLKVGNQPVQLTVRELSKYGERQSYYANFRIVNGELDIPKNAYAQGRDLHQVLVANDYFKEHLANSTLQITITKDLILKMEILDSPAPAFFTEEDFEQLAKFAKQNKEADNIAHQQVYDYLKTAYAKTAYWAKEVQQKLFPNGFTHVIQKPTNQANKFEYYHWAKIYPDKASLEYEILAFTIGIDTGSRFTIKIDTIGLNQTNEKRRLYEQFRGNYDNSKIVKHLPKEQVLDKGWKYLIDLTTDIILTLKPSYDVLLQSFQEDDSAITAQQPIKNNIAMALNTILYGPPGTGKTFKMQSLCKNFVIAKKVQTRQEFLEELISNTTWWETIAAALLDLKSSSVPNLEKHEFIQIKAKQSTTSNVKQIIWGSLQNRTDPSCEFVKFADRREPYLFMKDEKSVWTILEERVKNEAPEILNFLAAVKNFKPSSVVTQKNYKMITFHQSFSYEDFVEGIKPVMDDETTVGLQYTKAKGIFFHSCNEAAKLAGYDNLSDCLNDTPAGRKLKIASAPPFALFIDEINRANVSAVLGELITLVEEDKRLGRENEITDVLLPYSKVKFGIPANLYIIGTMNTADRSVEALDTALRRRFSFEEMPPRTELLSPQRMIWKLWWDYQHIDWSEEPYKSKEADLHKLLGVEADFDPEETLWNKMKNEGMHESQIAYFNPVPFNGINLEKMLAVINTRLKSLLYKDHTIGHAWLMNVFSLADLKKVFKNKIIPLLQEFFYNDYAKIGLVLGDAFVKKDKTERKLFARFDDELAAEYEDGVNYSLVDPCSEEITIDNFIAIYK